MKNHLLFLQKIKIKLVIYSENMNDFNKSNLFLL